MPDQAGIGPVLARPTWAANVTLPHPAIRACSAERHHPGDKRPWDSSARMAGVVARTDSGQARPPMLRTQASMREKLLTSARAARRYTHQLRQSATCRFTSLREAWWKTQCSKAPLARSWSARFTAFVTSERSRRCGMEGLGPAHVPGQLTLVDDDRVEVLHVEAGLQCIVPGVQEAREVAERSPHDDTRQGEEPGALLTEVEVAGLVDGEVRRRGRGSGRRFHGRASVAAPLPARESDSLPHVHLSPASLGLMIALGLGGDERACGLGTSEAFRRVVRRVDAKFRIPVQSWSHIRAVRPRI